jgi:hypothetical protein
LFGTDTLNSSGKYVHKLTNINGCDSTVTLHLTVFPFSQFDLSAAMCPGGVYLYAGDTLSIPGAYTYTLQTTNGCDSVVHLQLTVDSINATIEQASWNTLAVSGNGTIQWIDCNTGLPITGETANLFSTDTLGNFAAVFTLGDCTDTTACLQTLPNGLGSVASGSLNIYPNPANNYLLIQAEGIQPDWITIYSTSGQKITEMKFAPVIDISALTAGVYFVEVKAGSNIYRKMIVKM